MGITDMARKIPGVAAVEGAITGVLASEQDLPIKDYDKQTAADITAKLKGLSQRDLRTVGAYERKHENRATIIDKIAKLTGVEPWSGYDEQTADAITTALREAEKDTAQSVRSYERDRKARVGVLEAADQRIGE
jgi:SpoVK/Ycf46/Vps4 family AAA+-type ATPase